MRRVFTLIPLILLLAPVRGQSEKRDMELPLRPRPKAMSREDRKVSVHNGNKILTRFYNYGGIGDWTIGGRYDSGIYPQGSGRSYIAEFTPVVGASVVDTNGHRIHIVSDGMVSNNGKDLSPLGYQWGFEPEPGYANPNQDNIAMSDNPASWPETWPDRDETWDGFWNGQYGKYSRADQESYFVMDDYYNDEFAFFPDSNDSGKRGLGLKVEVRGYQWAHVAAEDIIIWTYWITNTGTSPLDTVVFGMYGDADIGDDGDQRDDDAWFDQENDIVYQWDHDGWSDAKGGFKPAYFGWKFLESPGNPHDGIDNDGDGMIDESQFDGIDNDGDWNPATDDLGTDGLGPGYEGYPGPDADGTEGNGQPDPGEPNFEYTDNDESDQIGLTSFFAAPWPNITASDDEVLWDQLQPGFFSVPEQTVDQTFLYGSGYFTLAPGERKKFAVAMVFGEDQDDILRNAVTMQAIYNSDYNFAKPPKKPTLTAVAGDHRVTLYWDQAAELSKDPIYGTDFEGYRIYRATDPALLEPWIITDAYGNRTFRKPIAQFDYEDGLTGPHPIAFNGIQFDMGKDTGLRHIWVDTTVENGQTYYYAITAYDKGYDTDFYERGLSEYENLQPLVPSECPIIVKQAANGEVEFLDVNVVQVTPNAPVAGYVPPNYSDHPNDFFTHDSGAGTGRLVLLTRDPSQVKDQNPYEVEFARTGGKTVYSVRDGQVLTDTVQFVAGWAGLPHKPVDVASVRLTNLSGTTTFQAGVDYQVDGELGLIEKLDGSLEEGTTYLVSYQYFPLYQSDYVQGEALNPVFDGIQLLVYDDPLALLADSSGWITGDCGWVPTVKVSDFQGVLYPADYEIRWEGGLGDSVSSDALFGVAAPFSVWNLSANKPSRFVIIENDHDGVWDVDEPIIILYGESGMNTCYQVDFAVDSLMIDTVFVNDTTWTLDTTVVPVEPAQAGDIIGIYTSKPFDARDRYSFTTTRSRVDVRQARQELDRIAVVPNPYVVTASWEPQHLFASGRGTRKVEFIHLPRECTIRIYTLSGYLVQTLHHSDVNENGAEEWNLLSRDGLEIAYGVYLYHVEAPGIGETVGKLAVIK
ncbi:MAG: hypothetical protein D6762_07565 [Candidatus Neomarinimicrobiota bacterium]|nr:MAG: hypothetical protein D6762_07565 [Candidatus Neomarinimicrobiota bacterium]